MSKTKSGVEFIQIPQKPYYLNFVFNQPYKTLLTIVRIKYNGSNKSWIKQKQRNKYS